MCAAGCEHDNGLAPVHLADRGHEHLMLSLGAVVVTVRVARPRVGQRLLAIEVPLAGLPAHALTYNPATARWEGDYDAFESFRDFGGIRIEDDVAVTSKGPDVLSRRLPKEPDAVEALVQSGSKCRCSHSCSSVADSHRRWRLGWTSQGQELASSRLTRHFLIPIYGQM